MGRVELGLSGFLSTVDNVKPVCNGVSGDWNLDNVSFVHPLFITKIVIQLLSLLVCRQLHILNIYVCICVCVCRDAFCLVRLTDIF